MQRLEIFQNKTNQNKNPFRPLLGDSACPALTCLPGLDGKNRPTYKMTNLAALHFTRRTTQD